MAGLDQLLERYVDNYPGFESRLDELEKEYPGKFAVVRGGEVVGIFDTAEEAQAGASDDAVVFEIRRLHLRGAVLM